MIRQTVVAASIALLGISGQAMAAQSAQLGSVSGSVLVNQDGRFAPVKGSTTLRAGDRVLAMNGAAKLTYADGCAVTIAPRSMVTVSEAACGSDANIIRAQYGNEGAGRETGFPGQGGPFESRPDLWLWLGYGVLTAAVMIAAFGNDEEPVSP
jgi:hypothetical protein